MAVGELLRHWRGVRRLSQLALALEAETTTRHVSFIETGRSQPSRAMVLRLARVLDVPIRERNQLLLAAGYAPVCTGDRARRRGRGAGRAPRSTACSRGTSRIRPS